MKNIALAILFLATMVAKAQVYNITTYGAVGDGATINTPFIQSAIDACSNAGGGVVEVPAGNFVTGTIFLKSNITFRIDSGGTITGSGQIADYPDVHPQIRSYTDYYQQHSVFYAEGQNNITITGPGTFDGGGLSLTWLVSSSEKPFGFRFISCRNVTYHDINLRNSGFWMMHNFNIDTLIIKNVNIYNQAFGNNDGFNIDGCRYVRIDSCTADCNDDAIVMKTTSPIGSDDIEISNCTVATYARALKIGTETSGITKNVYVHDCTVVPSTGPLSGRLGTCGINLATVDGGGMENIRFQDIHITGVETPIVVRLGDRAHKYTDTASTPGVGYVKDVLIRDIEATAETNIASTITGIPGYDAQNITLANFYITCPGGSPALSNGYVVPENIDGKPENDMFGDSIPASGLYIRHVDSIILYNVCFTAIQPDARPTVWADDVTKFDTAGVCGATVTITAINEVAAQDNIAVYPNPVTDNTIAIETNSNLIGSSITITDASGRQIQKFALNNTKQILNANQLSTGLYLLQIRSNNGALIATKKLMKY